MCPLACLAHRIARNRTARDVTGKQPDLRTSRPPVRAQFLQQPRRQHHVAVLAALALIDPKHHALAVDVGDLQVRGLGYPQPRCIGRHQNGPMLQAVDRLEEVHHLLGAEDHRQLERLLGHRDLVRRPGPLERHLVQEAQGRDGNADAARRELAVFDEMNLVLADLLRAQLVRPAIEVTSERRDLLQVRLLRVLGEVANAHVFEHPLA